MKYRKRLKKNQTNSKTPTDTSTTSKHKKHMPCHKCSKGQVDALQHFWDNDANVEPTAKCIILILGRHKAFLPEGEMQLFREQCKLNRFNKVTEVCQSPFPCPEA